jgi:hypothetical protein
MNSIDLATTGDFTYIILNKFHSGPLEVVFLYVESFFI